jgi:hypothetical protein
MGLALTAALAAQSGTNADTSRGATSQDTYQQQRQGNQTGQTSTSGTGSGTVSNPGFGPQIPNDSTLSGGQPHSNSTYQKDRNGNEGFDLGWLGLLGLAGLFGIGRGRASNAPVSNDMHHSGSNRS